MEKAQPLPSNSTTAAALEALRTARAKADAENAIAGNDLTSLNKFLQWSTAHSDPASAPSAGRDKHLAKTEDQRRADREWLDAAFPDMFADVKHLVTQLTAPSAPLSVDESVDTLEALEEFFVDLNYAVNIDKLGALQPLLDHTKSEHSRVRTAAVWALGSALQHLQEVKDVFMARDGHEALARCLRDEDPAVRAKAVMASSALLRHSTPGIRSRFAQVGGTAALRRLLADSNIQVRRRARFFLQHAPMTGNDDYVKDLLSDRNSIAALSESVALLDVDDVADVDAAVGALTVLVETDRQGLLQVAPELPGVVDSLAARCGDADLGESLTRLAGLLG